MTLKDLPIIPTILIVAAAATMVALGIWQIGRAEEKAALIARYSAAQGVEETVAFPADGTGQDVWFRRSEIACLDVRKVEPVAGTSSNGAKGWAMRASCVIPGGATVLIDLGFSRQLEPTDWQGGDVSGVIAPGPRLIANPAVAALEPLARPDPNDLPNNHIAYAGQWFFFALTALVIYVLALRSRARRRGALVA